MNYTDLDPNAWRPITFEGVTFPPTVMAISVLGSALTCDEELNGWLWAFPICRGMRKRASALECYQHASRARDLMLEQHDQVLEAIANHLGTHGMTPEITYRDWITALQQIADIAAKTDGECEWEAPSLPGEHEKMIEQMKRMKNFLDDLD